MRTILIIATLACYLIPCDAQEFSFSMYFKDAAGNKDTLVFGYDGNATHGLDPQFGETDYYGQQMNSELCVFAADSWYSSYRDTFLLYNKNIENKEDVESGNLMTNIYIKCKNYPLTI